MSVVDELRPCPFCGSPAEHLRTRAGDDFVRCTNPDCHLRTRQYHENAVGPADQWNERVTEDKLRQLLQDTWHFIFGSTNGGPISASEWHEKALSIHDRMRELGIEVD